MDKTIIIKQYGIKDIYFKTKNEFFKERFVVKFMHGRIEFHKTGLDYKGNDTIGKKSGKWLRFQTRPENILDIPLGEFEFDEHESTEDVKVVIF